MFFTCFSISGRCFLSNISFAIIHQIIAHIADMSAKDHSHINRKNTTIEKKNLYFINGFLIEENFFTIFMIINHNNTIHISIPIGVAISLIAKEVLLEFIIIGRNATTIITDNTSNISSIVAIPKIDCHRLVFVIFSESNIGISMASPTVAKDNQINHDISMGRLNIK